MLNGAHSFIAINISGVPQVTVPGTRINRGRRGTAISGIWPSRSRYRENDRDNRDKWNPKKHLQKLYFGISSRVSLFQTSSQSLQSNTIPSQAPLKSRD